MDKPNQRIGSKSNAHVGKEFEHIARRFFASEGLELNPNLKIPIGVSEIKKEHAFDLGSEKEKVLVECKSHKWTKPPNDNVPSAKLSVWNEAMCYFNITSEYRKIMFVLRDYSEKRKETLAEYYVRTSKHLIPPDVEFWEFDESLQKAIQLALNK